jgi:hypothetical protein
MPRHGHLPGHLRDCFIDALDAFYDWWIADEQSPPPKATLEVRYEPREISLEQACGVVWHCTDILPGSAFNQVQEIAEHHDLPLKRRTYAAAARVVKAALPSPG